MASLHGLPLQAAVPLVYIPLEAVVSKWYGESEKMLAGGHPMVAPKCAICALGWHAAGGDCKLGWHAAGDGSHSPLFRMAGMVRRCR